jgi:archaellum component FlaG (FlaF/FlaG flagellin family)
VRHSGGGGGKREIKMRKYATIHNIEVHLGFIVMFFIVILLSCALAAIYYTKTINHQASITTDGKIQAYLNVECNQTLDSYNWGTFNTSSADDVKTLDFYLKNEGNVEVNVTWIALDFTLYNETEMQYETPSWKLYLVNVDQGGVKIRPENDTTPDKLRLSPDQVLHLRFYLTAKENSPPTSNFTFSTSFNSKDN